MSRRWMAGIAAALALLLLAGCMREGKPRTVVIADSEQEQPADYGAERYAVGTIYRLPDGGETGGPLGWAGADAVLSLVEGPGSARSLELVSAPYDAGLKLEEMEPEADVASLSPDGQYAAMFDYTEGKLALVLLATGDRSRTTMADIGGGKLLTRKLGWSGNGRYVAFAVAMADTRELRLGVYDTVARALSWYPMLEAGSAEMILSIVVGNDGRSAAVTALHSEKRENILMVGSLTGSGFAPRYEHASGKRGEAEWLNSDQIAFIGPDDALYAYDTRNGALAVLLEQISSFRLSPDRKSIAYVSVGGDTVYAAELRGNNVLNGTAVYQGVVPALLAWSPDDRKLLVSGWKPYVHDRSTAPLPAEHPMPIQEGRPTSEGYQSLIVAFK